MLVSVDIIITVPLIRAASMVQRRQVSASRDSVDETWRTRGRRAVVMDGRPAAAVLLRRGTESGPEGGQACCQANSITAVGGVGEPGVPRP